ncbi:MAG TPA: aldose 1-epimerase family protein [Caulobacteraceae bacterium]|jgi:galactose mutarotase-like enzyme|nr:aldose 1-epimerase family protein [Caulobacteraceae bacterium]
MSEGHALVAISSEGLSAQINPLGAELHALSDSEGRGLLWDGDPSVWSGRAPILFPIVGALNGGQYRWGGKSYALPKHGFARRSLFEVVEASPSSATFRLEWSEETLLVYPFRFQLDVRFSVSGATLDIVATVRNLDAAAAMLASFGFHPAFRWPLPYGQPRAEHRIEFEAPEPEPIRRIDADGLVRPQGLVTPVRGRELALRDELFADDALIFDPVHSRKVRYGAGAGPRLEVAFPGTPRLGVWTKPGAGYVCIEPWRGVADPQGFDGDLSAKPGVFAVEPLQSAVMTMSVGLIVGG